MAIINEVIFVNEYLRLKTQTDWKEYIQKLVTTNDRALYRAILAIYKNQTMSERNIQATTEHNGVGFTGVDGAFMSSLAEQILKRKALSEKQLVSARKIMPKYWKQLSVISKEKIMSKDSSKVVDLL